MAQALIPLQIRRLAGTRVLEVTGRVDFAALVENHLTPLLEA